MEYFGHFYLDKEKDIVVNIEKEYDKLFYSIYVNNYKNNNLINNFASISKCETCIKNGKVMICGEVPCFIKGDGVKVYILRINGTKLANIYSDGKIEVNSFISSIAKTLMSQTKDYKYSYRDTLVKSYVLEDIKFNSDLHTHANANLNADCLIALALKHQIRYPLYYIKKLGLILTKKQYEYIAEQRDFVGKSINLNGLSGKYKERKIDDNTYINFADLILNNIENSSYNINKIRLSLTLLKDSQAVFTNLEKLYLYRYVFTKGVAHNYKIKLDNIERIEDKDIYDYLIKMLDDYNILDYKDNTFYEDTLLWIGREYAKRYITYVEISDTTLVKKDISAVNMLKQVHRILPLVKKETGVDIRFLAAIRRIPLTLVKENITSGNYLSEAMQALKVVSKDPYVVGSDFVGEEINDISELKDVIKEIVSSIAYYDKNWTMRVHAGENDSLKTNMMKSIEIIENCLKDGQVFPYMRIGHGIYSAPLKSKGGMKLLDKIKKHNIVLEFQLSSNIRLNNIIDLKKHPLKTYLDNNISCVMGTDGCGLYGTDSIDEQLALMNFLKLCDNDFMKMKETENKIINRQIVNFDIKMTKFKESLNVRNVEQYYMDELFKEINYAQNVRFAISKHPTYPALKHKVKELPWDKYPIIIAGGSFSSNSQVRISEADKKLLQSLLEHLDPKEFFFVIGHKMSGHEKYIIDHNKGFDIYSIVPSLLSMKQIKKILAHNIEGIRISTESQEMGIYKSFNYEIFERRNCALFAFDGNSSVANLVQEARNGKGKARIFTYAKSSMLKAKAMSLEGYVTMNADVTHVIEKLEEIKVNIGEKN